MKKTTLTIAALSALLVLSLGGNGYQYIQLKTANTTIADNAVQLEQQAAQLAEQTAEITRLSELSKEQTTEINTLTAKLEQAVKDMSMNSNKPILTEIEQEVYDMLIESGLTPEDALESVTGIPQTDPGNGTGGTNPPVNNGGTTGKPTAPEAGTDPPKAPKPPATSKKPINPATNKPWTEAELQDWRDAYEKEHGNESGGPLTEQPAGDGAAEDIGSGGYQ